jgi:hypothetical protein
MPPTGRVTLTQTRPIGPSTARAAILVLTSQAQWKVKSLSVSEDSYKPMILPKRRVKYDIREISCLCKIGCVLL